MAEAVPVVTHEKIVPRHFERFRIDSTRNVWSAGIYEILFRQSIFQSPKKIDFEIANYIMRIRPIRHSIFKEYSVLGKE